MRKLTRKIKVGNVEIGGNSPISVQSMTNTDTRNIAETVAQIKKLEAVGCEISRVAILDTEAVEAIKEIKKGINNPLVADIHFDYRLAIKAIENGADKIRINPGNIGESDRLKKVVDVAKERGIPIRVGVNSGSLEKSILEKHGGPTDDALVESAIHNVKLIEDFGYDNMIVSIKASNVITTVNAYKKFSEKLDYPLHIGITEAGTAYSGTIRTSVGLGILLNEGIGDTLRVSLTGDPTNEIRAGIEILNSLGIRRQGVRIISCPTCGRCKVNLANIAEKIEAEVFGIDKSLTVAVMGCAVNGPGEAKEADLGVACGDKCGLIFVNGEIIKKVPEDKIIQEILKEIRGN